MTLKSCTLFYVVESQKLAQNPTWRNFCIVSEIQFEIKYVKSLKGKEKVAKVIPNAILISTENDKHFLTSFTSRDKTYLMLFRVWQNALMETPVNTQELWQWVRITASLSLNWIWIVDWVWIFETSSKKTKIKQFNCMPCLFFFTGA